NWQVRQTAIHCLGILQAPESIPTLLEKLDEKDPQLKIQAMEVLDAFDYREGTTQLLNLLTDPNLMVRQHATDCLIRINDQKIAPTIILLMRNPDVNIRRCAVEILKNLKAPNTTEVFMQALKDTDWWVRQVATSSLATLHGDTDIITGFISLTRDPDHNLRRCAVEFLNNVVDPAAFDALIERLDDDDDWVREKALRALSKLGDKRAITPIANLIDNTQTGPGVPRALATIGSEDALWHLIRFLKEKPKQLKMETIKALGMLKNKNATDAIIKCQSDPDEDIVTLAVETLKTLTGSQFTNMATERLSNTKGRQGSQQIAPGSTINEAFLILELDDSADTENHRYDDTLCLNMMKNMTKVVSPLIHQELCRFSKGIDNGFIMTFPKAMNAVRFAQNSLIATAEFNKQADEHEQIHLRFTIHSGEATIGEQNDRIGVARDMTQRIMEIDAKKLIPIKGSMNPKNIPTSNRILISEQVVKEIRQMQGLQTQLVGLFELKGITGLHKIYSLT
ncbi:MAG: HEAT repeat domain-containing protein, partial [Desulfobulbaceae bacterium]|nr:HEAT repeat domain-containing protein [Desulfobulbaceae bacterium]